MVKIDVFPEALPPENMPLSPPQAIPLLPDAAVSSFQPPLAYILVIEFPVSYQSAPFLGLLGSEADEVYSQRLSVDVAEPS